MEKMSDSFLNDRVVRYDQWVKAKEIAYASKIIPIRESINAQQWVLPTDQVLDIIKAAEPIGLTDCVCRSHYKRCDHPVNICLVLNSVAAKQIESRRARKISLTEAGEVLQNANNRGLVHLSFYRPGPEIYALCSCCECCCHDLQILKQYQRTDLVVRSDFLAQDNRENCIHCGECVERCVFGARVMSDDEMVYDPMACYGCGLCATTCPVDAIEMVVSGKKDS